MNVKPNAALLAIFTKAKSAGYYRACKLLLWILDSTRPLFYMPRILCPTPSVLPKVRSSSSKCAIFPSWCAKGKILWCKWSKTRLVLRVLA
ncbi:Uncharacterised protein [Vibrio cholerae]|nr:Uncharacterised protein [Vibrio cholerae]CSI17202.1 Uncharacterised protein [Vibrio cholerae]